MQNFIKKTSSPEALRELGKTLYYSKDATADVKEVGLQYLLRAQKAGDPEAQYIIARLIFSGAIKPNVEKPIEHALSLLCSSANEGCAQARSLLNQYCDIRYDSIPGTSAKTPHIGGLVDFDGMPIHIDRKGVFTPIDARLERRGGENVLSLSTNLSILYSEELSRPKAFTKAVLDGIRLWEGEYTVFGGQKLRVEINITTEDRLFDNVVIVPVTGDMAAMMKTVSDTFASEEKKEQLDSMMTHKRSFAVAGLKWSVTSRKFIYIQSESGKFDELEEIKHIAKHEFGHALGLGDLYESSSDQLGGVAAGTYKELDAYRITDKFYNLVMCDHHGPVSNNDIEMVVLAFRDNRMQLYQPGMIKGDISKALGKGN